LSVFELDNAKTTSVAELAEFPNPHHTLFDGVNNEKAKSRSLRNGLALFQG